MQVTSAVLEHFPLLQSTSRLDHRIFSGCHMRQIKKGGPLEISIPTKMKKWTRNEGSPASQKINLYWLMTGVKAESPYVSGIDRYLLILQKIWSNWLRTWGRCSHSVVSWTPYFWPFYDAPSEKGDPGGKKRPEIASYPLNRSITIKYGWWSLQTALQEPTTDSSLSTKRQAKNWSCLPS
jgi:hypothetical protein